MQPAYQSRIGGAAVRIDAIYPKMRLTGRATPPILSGSLTEGVPHYHLPESLLALSPQRNLRMTTEFEQGRAIDVQAFGQPGQRTFRLRIVGQASETASIWLEKEQLQALSLALKQMLAQLDYEEDPPNADVGDFPASADHDFRAGRLGMGFQPSDRTVVLFVYEIGAPEDEEAPTLRVRLDQEKCASLTVNLDDIIAGGRPQCPLCGMPMEAVGHACIRSNGHSKQPIPDQDTGEEPS
jgi:uncharacterized repeat protein (TIGR03847 family)